MKHVKTLSEHDFLKRFFLIVSAAFLIGAVCMPDRGQMLTGLADLVCSPSKLSTNCFQFGFAATFLNMGLVALIGALLFWLPGAVANNVSTLAFLLTLGFASWGVNVVNLWFGMLGVAVHCLIKKKPLGSMANAMLFSTGIAPIYSELIFRYPGTEVGFRFTGLLLAVLVGIAAGLILPSGLTHAPNVHKGFNHYSAAVPIGMTAFALQGILFKAPGLEIPGAVTTLDTASKLSVNVFCGILFGLCILGALALGCRPKDYLALLQDSGKGVSFSTKYGNATFLMNLGVYGLFILLVYNLIGVGFNAVTFGLIFCMVCTCNSGSHPVNVLPIVLAYYIGSLLLGLLSQAVGGTFSQAISVQAIAVGLCFSNGLSPISGVYGMFWGFLAGLLHFCMVTTVPSLHGGFCLYNGGFTAAFVCLLLIPCLENYIKPKSERLPARK